MIAQQIEESPGLSVVGSRVGEGGESATRDSRECGWTPAWQQTAWGVLEWR